jgi:VWFA-related protein
LRQESCFRLFATSDHATRETFETMPQSAAARIAALVLMGTAALVPSSTSVQGQETIRFRSGVELININATVTDRSGRFVHRLQQRDFTVYEDGRPMEVTHFSAERVPVSLGIVLDASGSMKGEKMAHARAAIERFLAALGPDDEVFLYTFASNASLEQDWTMERRAVSSTLQRVRPVGGTAMYDALVGAVPMAQTGRHPKKAVVLLSDGIDTDSRASLRDVRRIVRETEVLVYAVGVDGQARPAAVPPRAPRFPPSPFPFPTPRRGRPRPPWPFEAQQFPLPMGRGTRVEGVNVGALRQITDDSGGRTEIVRRARDLDPATASIAAELSRQYHLAYVSPGHRDGAWHEIRVQLRDPSLQVRARRGYFSADP